jgi:hypothetical protein
VGLGLHIARNLVEAVGGSIQARCYPDRGSTLVITLPARSRGRYSSTALVSAQFDTLVSRARSTRIDFKRAFLLLLPLGEFVESLPELRGRVVPPPPLQIGD